MNRVLVAAASALLLLALVAVGEPSPALAGVVCEASDVTEWETGDGGNGHFYQAVCANGDEVTWDEARHGAESLGGHLVTLESEEENDFVAMLLTNRGYWGFDGSDWCPGPFIGLWEPGDDDEPDGGWEWVTDEPFDYENWAAGEPNNNGGFDENRAAYGEGGCAPVTPQSDEWHDVGDEDEHRAFVVEWDDGVPECTNTPVVQWLESEGGNGHFYQGICEDMRITWENAQQNADAIGGHLATNTSAEENDFVFQLIDAPQFWSLTTYKCIVGPWLGGFQEDGSSEPDEGWAWVTGEPFDYTNWADEEPDDFDNDEFISYFDGCPGDERTSEWVDLVGGGLGEVMSYVVEWEADAQPYIMGDADCDGDVDFDDLSIVLGAAAGLPGNDACSIVSDVGTQGIDTRNTDCDPDVDGFDALLIMRFLAEVSALPLVTECTPVGEAID